MEKSYGKSEPTLERSIRATEEEPLLGENKDLLHISDSYTTPNVPELSLNNQLNLNKCDISTTRRNMIENVLYSYKYQLGIMILVFVDLSITVFDIMIEMQYYKNHCFKKKPSIFAKLAEIIHGSCYKHIFHYLSTSLSFLYLIEIFLKIYIFRLKYFRMVFELFDAVVIICSFSTDVYFIDTHDPIKDLTGLVILFRFFGVAIHIKDISAAIKKKALMVKDIEIAKLKKKYTDLQDFVKNYGIIVTADNGNDIITVNSS